MVDTVTVQPCGRAYCSPDLSNGGVGIFPHMACVVASVRWFGAGGGANRAEFTVVGELVSATTPVERTS